MRADRGLYAGGNYQIGAAVLGLETDIEIDGINTVVSPHSNRIRPGAFNG